MELVVESGELEQRLLQVAVEAVTACDLVLYDWEYHDSSKIFRLYILNPLTDTANLDECVQVDRAMSGPLDTEWVPENFVLEVSSPGVNRHLRTKAHFQMVLGKEIVLVTPFKLSGERFAALPKTYQGQGRFNAFLLAADEEQVLLSLPVKGQEGYQLTLKYQDIKKANLEFRI